MNIFLKAYKIESVLYVHAPLVFKFIKSLEERENEKIYLKILLANMKTLTNSMKWSRSCFTISGFPLGH